MSLARKIAAALMVISNPRRYAMKTKKCLVCDWVDVKIARRLGEIFFLC